MIITKKINKIHFWEVTGTVTKEQYIKASDELLKLFKNGKVEATAMQFPQVMAETAAQYADEYFKGKREFPKKMPVAVELVTQNNVGDYIAYGKKEEGSK